MELKAILSTAFSLCLCACVPAVAPQDVEHQPLSSDYAFLEDEAPKALTKAEEAKVAQLNDFAFAFSNCLQEQAGSYVYSPVSIAFVLGMLSEGAAGQTRSEICAALGFDPEDQQGINEFCRDLCVIAKRAASKEEIFEIANAILADKSIPVKESFCRNVKGYYNADILQMDFNTEDVASYINKWAAERTHDRITHVVDNIPPSIFSVFINALYFKASWADGFMEVLTSEGPFKGADGKTRTEMMMHKKVEYIRTQYARGSNFSMVSLPYGEELRYPGQFEMSFLLPDDGISVEKVLSGLDGKAWADIHAALSKELVDLMIPRFETSSDLDINSILKQLGIRTAYDSIKADFSNFSSAQLWIDTVKHIANISVDEKGTEAAAVTVAMMAGATPDAPEPQFKEFHADRPFIFAITEKTTGAILFLGCYR